MNYTYYVAKEGDIYVLRQTRYQSHLLNGQEHPNDVCAMAATLEDLKGMVVGWGSINWSAVQ